MLKFNLKKKVEKQCNKNGYVDEVYKILEYSDGLIVPENLSANALYNITYQCKICLPIENSIIISQVKVVNPELVVTINGPIMTFIPKENIDTNYWNVLENFTYNLNHNIKLKVGDYVLVQITNKRINTGDTQIKTIGKLLDIATEDHIKEFFIKNIDEETDQDQTNFIL